MKVSESDNLAYVLKHFTNYRHGTLGQESVGGGDTWSGVKLLKDVGHQRIADRLLGRNWHNRKCASAIMIMAREVEHLLALKLLWKKRVGLGRVLISSLTHSSLYYIERDPPDSC